MSALPALHMSHIIAADAPLTSPISESLTVPWDRDPALAALYDPFALPAPSSLAAAVPDSRLALKGRATPDATPEACVSTHQVFDLAPSQLVQMSSPASSPSSSPQMEMHDLPGAGQHTFSASGDDECESLVPSKRPSVTIAGNGQCAKKPRAAERVSTKDFVPPDVTGLSKREARLVKNRAAAFLSRQRKREEFENMEIRVAELEQENARLLASIQQTTPPPSGPEDILKSELEQLRRQLAETQQRERELAEKLEGAPVVAPTPAAPAAEVKMEAVEPSLPVSLRAHKGERSGASFGLMVLLCALPTLLSMPAHTAISNSMSSFSHSHSHSHSHSTSLDMTSFGTGDLDWGFGFGSGAMDLDLAPSSLVSDEPAEPEFKKLEFADEKLGLGGLDISFDATAAKEGRIRVRIHPPASENGEQAEDDHTMWQETQDDLGPFLGVGADFDTPSSSFGSSSSLHPLDFSFPQSSSSYSSASSPSHLTSPTSAFFSTAPSPTHVNEYEFDLGSEYGSVGSGMSRAGSPGISSSNGRRRVRIALRGMPGKGKEGGEWEVEVC
ncbi:uncharacterized protein BXZ73DRAFT_49688 [Epithele typhae]|uniref:uncharacterized protein n=1 Tax=Epithele typhae TaxID=378194 RepID=UPI00200759EE|nr:uncharacterized protein BXZ73DRAFT_49688 [Epithele typhae]KAH9925930.1 hypothetical protein BXZ73DRAFT_49688 [Epithele typhae]